MSLDIARESLGGNRKADLPDIKPEPSVQVKDGNEQRPEFERAGSG